MSERYSKVSTFSKGGKGSLSLSLFLSFFLSAICTLISNALSLSPPPPIPQTWASRILDAKEIWLALHKPAARLMGNGTMGIRFLRWNYTQTHINTYIYIYTNYISFQNSSNYHHYTSTITPTNIFIPSLALSHTRTHALILETHFLEVVPTISHTDAYGLVVEILSIKLEILKKENPEIRAARGTELIQQRKKQDGLIYVWVRVQEKRRRRNANSVQMRQKYCANAYLL